jgi:hypothetical protein
MQFQLVQQEWHSALPEEEGWRLFQQIIEGLVYMSSLKIVGLSFPFLYTPLIHCLRFIETSN